MKRTTTITEYEAVGQDWVPVKQTVTEVVDEGNTMTPPPFFPSVPYSPAYPYYHRPVWYSTTTNDLKVGDPQNVR